MAPHTWIVGPIAWDSVIQLPHLPEPGGFVQAEPLVERPGGAGANVAVALASAGVPVHMVGYVGRDRHGSALLADLSRSGVDVAHVQPDHPHTSHVLIFVEPDGERTMVGLAPDTLHDVPVPVDRIGPSDLVYVAGWRGAFEPALRPLIDRGTTVVTVPPEEPWTRLDATYVVGSQRQLGGADPATDRRYHAALAGPTKAVVLTCGAAGVRIYRAGKEETRPSRPARVVDATGAGDAFAAGFLLRIEQGLSEAVSAGLAWAACAVAVARSQPPPWSVVMAGLGG
jgi:sugar/nucleoside kinase (ribokinase family)